MIRFEDIRHVHLEPSSRCQAKCPLCSRNKWGWGERKDFIQTNLRLDDCKRIFDRFPRMQLDRIDMNGNFGDPCINPDIKEIIRYLFQRFPRLRLGIMTNGGMQKPEWWMDLIPTQFLDRSMIHFSIDGLEDTNHLYRIGVPYDKVIANARSFISVGGMASWKWVPFRHNEHQVEEAEQRSRELGFQSFEVTDQGRDYVYVQSDDYWIRPTTDKKDRQDWEDMRSAAPYDDISFAKRFDSTPDKDAEREASYARNPSLYCHTKEWRSVYIDSQGYVWPCCIIGHDPLRYRFQHSKQLLNMIGDANCSLLEVDFEQASSWWHKVEDSWSKPTIREGLSRVCLQSCHRC
jgi:MoaA/NifB/PqqE/SkfB family radical SAM enzyme